MKLLMAGPSPFVRKVLVLLHETGQTDDVETVQVTAAPGGADATLKAAIQWAKSLHWYGTKGQRFMTARSFVGIWMRVRRPVFTLKRDGRRWFWKPRRMR